MTEQTGEFIDGKALPPAALAPFPPDGIISDKQTEPRAVPFPPAIITRAIAPPVPSPATEPPPAESTAISPDRISRNVFLELLSTHVAELAPDAIGKHELLSKAGEPFLAAIGCTVNRENLDPPLTVEDVVWLPGTMEVVVGPNGAGKSTLFNAFMGIDTVELSTDMDTGAYRIGTPKDGRPKLRIARLFQEELFDKLGDLTVDEVIRETAEHFRAEFPDGWEAYGKYVETAAMDQSLNPEAAQRRSQELFDQAMANDAVRQRIDRMLAKATAEFGLAECIAKRIPLSKLSGGERTKVSLLIMLLSQPHVILADEPTNHLDLRTASELLGIFEEYKNDGCCIVCVSHTSWFLNLVGVNGVTRIERHNGKSTGMQIRTAKRSPTSHRNFVQNPDAYDVATLAGTLEWGQPEYDRKAGSILIKARPDVSVPQSPLAGVTVPEIAAGSLTLFSGDNGTGKTHLMDLFMRSKDPNVNAAYLPQFFPPESREWTIGDFFDWIKNRASPLSTGAADNKDLDPKTAFARKLRDMKFGGANLSEKKWPEKNFGTMSPGEQRLLWFVAVTSLRDVDMLVLDEPTNHMEANMLAQVSHLLLTFPGAVAFCSHDIDLLTAVTDQANNPGNLRTIRHSVLVKDNGRTRIEATGLSPKEYAQACLRKGKEHGQRLMQKLGQ